MANFPSREPLSDRATGLLSARWNVYFRDRDQQSATTTQQAATPVVLTGKTATIATTPIPGAALAPGTYRVSVYQRVTTAAGVSSDITTTISFTDGAVACSFVGATMNGNTTSTVQTASYTFTMSASAPVSYGVVYNSNPAAAMAFTLTVVLEQLALTS